MFRQILVSSAYNAMLVPGEICFVISVMNKIYKVEPIIDPCGTPEKKILSDEFSLPITTHWLLTFR